MSFFADLERVRARWNVLEHPFYQRWSDGELTRYELALYAGQYRHAVRALATAAAEADVDASHAAEEAAHVDLWDDFGRAVGGAPDAPAIPETVACVRAWAREDRGELETLVALYAIESGQPAISDTKRIGLRERYGFEDGPGLRYFDVHAELDHEHAAAERAAIEPRLDGADADALLAEAERVLRGNWELLDGVERLCGRSPSLPRG